MYLYRNQGNLSLEGALGAGLGGFVGGAAGGAAGPAGGTIAKQLGKSSSGLLATGATALINAGGGAAGNLTSQLVANPGDLDWGRVAEAGGYSGVASGVVSGAAKVPGAASVLGSPHGMNTLKQASYFGPRTFSGITNFAATNTRAVVSSAGVGALVGMFGP